MGGWESLTDVGKRLEARRRRWPPWLWCVLSMTMMLLWWGVGLGGQVWRVEAIPGCLPVAINRTGTVLCQTSDYQAWLWSPEVGVQPIASGVIVSSLNNAGAVVGWGLPCDEDPDLEEPFLWHAGQVSCPSPRAGMRTYALAIDDAQQLAGWAAWPCCLSGEGPIYWPSPPAASEVILPADFGRAVAINQRGVIAGWYSYAVADLSHGNFRYDTQTRTLDVRPESSDFFPTAVGISADGAVLIGNGVVWHADHHEQLIAPPDGCAGLQAEGMSPIGQAVGQVTCDGTPEAWLWTAGVGTQRLRDLVPDPTWAFTSSTAINARGQMVGEGVYQGEAVGYRATPPAASVVQAAWAWWQGR
jgi:hypothetical protein